MEPHSHIAHNRGKHIGFYVKNYVSICLCGSFSLRNNDIFIANSPSNLRCNQEKALANIFKYSFCS